MRHRISLLVLALGASLAGNAGAHANERGLDRRNFDPEVPACVNFYLHGNGGWIKSNPIPPEYSTWSIGNEMRERNLRLLRQVLEEAATQDAAPGRSARKMGELRASGRWRARCAS